MIVCSPAAVRSTSGMLRFPGGLRLNSRVPISGDDTEHNQSNSNMFADSPASCAQLILLQNVRSGPGSPIAFALAKNALGGRMRNAKRRNRTNRRGIGSLWLQKDLSRCPPTDGTSSSQEFETDARSNRSTAILKESTEGRAAAAPLRREGHAAARFEHFNANSRAAWRCSGSYRPSLKASRRNLRSRS
jgi:hypothetical protein